MIVQDAASGARLSDALVKPFGGSARATDADGAVVIGDRTDDGSDSKTVQATVSKEGYDEKAAVSTHRVSQMIRTTSQGGSKGYDCSVGRYTIGCPYV